MNAILAGAQIHGAGAKGIAGPARHESRQIGLARDHLHRWMSNETEIGTKSGSSDTRDAAMTAAKRAIDNALDAKKRKLLPPA